MSIASWRPNETWIEWRARQVRYERWLRRLGMVAAAVLACTLVWVAIGYVLS